MHQSPAQTCDGERGEPVGLSWCASAAVFVLVSALLFSPLYPTWRNWGGPDWDQHCFYHEVGRKSLLQFGQFPLWNPYHCGGTAALAEPQSAFLSLNFPLILVFGTVAGLKLGLILHTALGMFGMFLLSKHFGLSRWSAYLPSLVFFLSSWYPLHLIEGHTIYVTYAYLPYVFLLYLRGIERPRYALLSGVGIALMFLGGGLYTIQHTLTLVGLHVLLTLIATKRLAAVRALAIALAAAFCLAAIKALPVLEFLSVVYKPASSPQYTSWRLFFLGLFSRHQVELYLDRTLYLLPSMTADEIRQGAIAGTVPWRWHEYGAYLGIIPAVLATLALVHFRRHWRLILCAGVCLALALGRAFPGNPWGLMHYVPLLARLHGPSRFVIPLAFCASLLAGVSLSHVERYLSAEAGPRWLRRCVPALIGIVALDLMWVGMPTLRPGFDREPVAFKERSFRQTEAPNPYLSHFAAVLQNVGIVNGYARTSPDVAAIPTRTRDGKPNPAYVAEAYLAETKQPADIWHFSPNQVHVAVPASSPGTLVLNQNYLKGWRVAGRRVKPHQGLVSVEVTPADDTIVFRYLPTTFVVGLIISVASLGAMAIVFARRSRRRAPNATPETETGRQVQNRG